MKTLFAAILTLAALATAEPIKHRFVVADEPGHRIVHVDQNHPENNWERPVTENKTWDIQLAGDNQLAVSFTGGYLLVDLNNGELIKKVTVDGLTGIWSVRRLAKGKTVVIGNQGPTLYAAELDEDNHIVRKATVPDVKQMRLGRITPEGHALAAPGDELVEWDLDGTIIKRFPLPQDPVREKGLKAFMALKDSDGCYWVAYGYGAITVKLDPDGKILQKFIGPEGMHFTAGFQRLPNGNLVQANWSGHKVENAVNGPQLIEFNPQGEIVWTYHNTDLFACPVSVIILDDLNTQQPAGDSDSILKNFN